MIITNHNNTATHKTPLNPKATDYFPIFTTQKQHLPFFTIVTITVHHPPLFIMIPSKSSLSFNPLQLSPPLSPQKPDQGYLMIEPGFTESGSADATEPTTVIMVKKTRKPKILGRVLNRADQPALSTSFWVKKDVVHDAELSSYPFGDSTSLMIRNIPIRLSRSELIDLLDEHCRIENDKISAGQNDDEPPSAFDFLYLPIDFKRKGNLGYAFVNFTTWQGASRLYNAWKGNKWETCPYNTTKIAKICRAKYQGKRELIKHFEASVFRCDKDEYLPVEISPPRNGVNFDETQITTIGTRVW